MGPRPGTSVLVTGGLGGIGRAVGRRLGASGFHPVLADLVPPDAEHDAVPAGTTVVDCDVRDPAAVEAAVDRADRVGDGLGGVVLAAGLAPGGSPNGALDVDRYRTVMGVNVDGVVFGLDAAVPVLRRRGGGAIVAVASIAGLIASPTDPVYAATKHAVVGLVRALGAELEPVGVHLNALCPGVVDTPIIGHIREEIERSGTPLLRADEVADGCVRLLHAERCGEAWFIQPGWEATPFRFANLPGPRDRDGNRVGTPPVFDRDTRG